MTRYDIKKCAERLLEDFFKAKMLYLSDQSTYNSKQYSSLKKELVSYISSGMYMLEAQKQITPYVLGELGYDIDVLE